MPILATKDTCTGCAACGNICPKQAIQMKPDSLGFIVPEIDSDKCIDCGLCEKACPIVNGRLDELKNPESERCYAFWSDRYRTSSSSGGAFSAIASGILQAGGIVYGASWTAEFVCGHISIEQIADLPKLQGSKYLQSAIGYVFKEIKTHLDQGRKVLFTGTPCQVGGLKSFLRRDHDNLTCIDIVCHGVPSNAIFQSYIEKLKQEYPEYRDETGFQFRHRRAWGIAPRTTPQNSRRVLTGVPNLYMLAFEKSLFFRRCCYDCQFNGLQRVGDITLADFWGINKSGTPFRHDVTKGVSLVIPNSSKGENLLNRLDEVFMEQRDLAMAARHNDNLLHSSPLKPERESVISDFIDPLIPLAEIARKYNLVSNSTTAKLKRLLTRIGLFYTAKSIYNKISIWI